MARAFALLLSVVISACAHDRYYIDNVAYDSEGAWLSALQKGNSEMVAAIHRRSQPVAGSVRIFRPSSDYLDEWLAKYRLYARCVAYICRSEDERSRERDADVISLRENYLSTSRAIERSGLFGSVSTDDYSGVSQLPSGDPERWLIFIRPNLEDQKAGWSWYVWKPGSRIPEPLPNFDETIQPRERRVNDWIDKLEATLEETT